MQKVIVTGLGKRTEIIVNSPSSLVYTILETFCQTHQLNPVNYQLKDNKGRIVDLNISWRLSGLVNNGILEIVPISKDQNKQMQFANIVIELEQGVRVEEKFDVAIHSLWSVILTFEAKIGKSLGGHFSQSKTGIFSRSEIIYKEPVIIYMNKRYIGIETLSKTLLQSLGITGKDRTLLRLQYQDSTKPKTKEEVQEERQNAQKLLMIQQGINNITITNNNNNNNNNKNNNTNNNNVEDVTSSADSNLNNYTEITSTSKTLLSNKASNDEDESEDIDKKSQQVTEKGILRNGDNNSLNLENKENRLLKIAQQSSANIKLDNNQLQSSSILNHNNLSIDGDSIIVNEPLSSLIGANSVGPSLLSSNVDKIANGSTVSTIPQQPSATKKVGDWLENIGMGKYVDTFLANDLNDIEVVSQLTAEELERNLGIKSFGDRKKLLLEIRKLSMTTSMVVTTAQPPPRSEETDTATNKNDVMQIDHTPQQQQQQSQPIINTNIIKQKQKKPKREGDIENIIMKDTNLKIIPISEKIDATHVKIFEGGSSSSSLDDMLEELEDEDFEVSIKDFQRISANQKQKNQQEDDQKLFFSKKQNQPSGIVCNNENNRKEYKAALIRVRLGPYILQGTFSPDHKLLSVIQMIKAVVEPFDFPISLYQSPPVKRFEDPSKTLRELGLIPAAVINISYPTPQTTSEQQKQPKPALSIKQEFKQYIQSFGEENFPDLDNSNEKRQ